MNLRILGIVSLLALGGVVRPSTDLVCLSHLLQDLNHESDVKRLRASILELALLGGNPDYSVQDEIPKELNRNGFDAFLEVVHFLKDLNQYRLKDEQTRGAMAVNIGRYFHELEKACPGTSAFLLTSGDRYVRVSALGSLALEPRIDKVTIKRIAQHDPDEFVRAYARRLSGPGE